MTVAKNTRWIVALGSAGTVSMPASLRDLPQDSDGVTYRELTLAVQALAERLPFDEGHDVEEEARGLARGRKRSGPSVAASSGMSTLIATRRSWRTSFAR